MARAMLYNNDVARKLWGLLVIQLIECILDLVPRTLHMSYGREGSQMLSILELLEVLVSFSRIERMWEIFWDSPLQKRLIGYTTKEP